MILISHKVVNNECKNLKKIYTTLGMAMRVSVRIVSKIAPVFITLRNAKRFHKVCWSVVVATQNGPGRGL